MCVILIECLLRRFSLKDQQLFPLLKTSSLFVILGAATCFLQSGFLLRMSSLLTFSDAINSADYCFEPLKWICGFDSAQGRLLSNVATISDLNFF